MIDRTVVVALGSNLGDSKELLVRAIARLEDLAAGGFMASSIQVSAPVDCPAGSPDFLNAVVVFESMSDETPESLLEHLQGLEVEFGRQGKTVMNEPRRLDLDIIAFGEERRNTAALVIPHPRAHMRLFVMAPLAEIMPAYRAPGWPIDAGGLATALRAS